MTSHPSITLFLWTEDAIVLFDWLESVDLNSVPTEHNPVKEALADLHSRLGKVIPYEFPQTEERIAQARHEVSKDMNW